MNTDTTQNADQWLEVVIQGAKELRAAAANAESQYDREVVLRDMGELLDRWEQRAFGTSPAYGAELTWCTEELREQLRKTFPGAVL